ncbi:hypothetical protein EDB80DRAFT_694758 [Ilyonectria destructans]|nr:hypothetical protein EDB80DRAFT_694758 [Ilyonectria destructans]
MACLDLVAGWLFNLLAWLLLSVHRLASSEEPAIFRDYVSLKSGIYVLTWLSSCRLHVMAAAQNTWWRGFVNDIHHCETCPRREEPPER